MEQFAELFYSLIDLIIALWNVAVAAVRVLIPWVPLAAWIGYWLCCVDWKKLGPILARGGVLALFFTGFVMILVWGVVAPPEGGVHHLFGLELSNFVGKTVYVTSLICIMLLCGFVQVSGVCDQFCRSEEEEVAEAAAH